MKQLKKPKKLQRPILASVILLFALLGSVAIWRTFASNPNLTGDSNSDNTVNIQDIAQVLRYYGTTNTTTDVNGDSVINIQDIATILSHYGQTYIPPTGTSYVFQDEFSGASGSPADTSKWILHNENCNDGPADYACPKNTNVYQDGSGNLVLRTKREPSGYLGKPYSGAWLSTFGYGLDPWPPDQIKAGVSVPYKIEMRAIMPNTPGAWPSIWSINVDRPNTQNIYELDIAEERMTFPTSAGCHQHTWLGGADKSAWDGSANVSNMGLNWHTYSANVYTDRVEYKVDGLPCGTAYGVSGRHGIILNNVIADPNSWGSNYGSKPADTDPGPWDFIIDYIRVTAL